MPGFSGVNLKTISRLEAAIGKYKVKSRLKMVSDQESSTGIKRQQRVDTYPESKI